MTVNDLKKSIQEIQERGKDGYTDDERYDGLRVTVLHAIADGECDDPAACAKLVLSVGWPGD